VKLTLKHVENLNLVLPSADINSEKKKNVVNLANKEFSMANHVDPHKLLPSTVLCMQKYNSVFDITHVGDHCSAICSQIENNGIYVIISNLCLWKTNLLYGGDYGTCLDYKSDGIHGAFCKAI